ncbi:Gfo/Idh/MocA family protein [Halorientalis pallida]|uniref:Gfo/Idh/MocA family protein n=1 Tax=Halorientalis pallida TaxID=2479928 RepID=UPI003C6FD414
METISVGVVGCGKIAERHINAYAKLDGVDVTITDIDESKRSVAEEYGVEWCTDPDTLIERADIDAIDVCVPVTAHEDVISQSLGHDKDVFCEKPLARTTAQARRIREKADQTDNIVMVGYLYRFHPAFQFVKEVLDERIIGSPHYAIFRVGGRGSHRPWKHKQAAGGGVGNEMLVHMLDLVFWYFGEPQSAESLHTDTILREREIGGETVQADANDLALLNLDMNDGFSVLCQSDLLTPSYMNYVEIHGSNGSIFTTILDYFPTIVYCQERRGIYDKGRNVREFDRVDLFERELDQFVDCVRTGSKPELNDVADSVAVRSIIESTIEGEPR